MIEPVWIVGFSGHRPGDGAGRSVAQLRACRAPLRTALAQLQERAAKLGGRIELLTQVAAGADLEAAEAAQELDITVHVILPLSESRFAEDFTDEQADAWSRAQRFIDAARAGERGATFRIAHGAAERPDCYHEAGLQMLHSCDLLLAVWNGAPAAGLGGAAEVIEHAQRISMPVVRIDPSQSEPTPSAPPADWPTRDPIVEHIQDIALAELKAHKSKCQEESPVSDGVAGRTFWLLDHAATRLGARFRGRLIQAVMLHFIAAMLAATNASLISIFHDTAMPYILTWIELGLVTWALWIMLMCLRQHLSHQWRQSRFGAEVLRGLRESAGWLDPLNPLILHHLPLWRRFAVSLALVVERERDLDLDPDLEHRKQLYLTGRIVDQRDAYFRKEHQPAERSASVLRVVGLYSSIFAVPFVLAALIVKANFPDWVQTHWAGSLQAYWYPIALPLIAGAATSLTVAKDAARRAGRYRRMVERLDAIASDFPGLKTPGAVRQAVASTEELLLGELVEWYIVAESTGH